MPAIDGLVKKRLALTANTAQEITFAQPIQNLDIALMGSANVAFKIGATPSSPTDDTANFLNSDVPTFSVYTNNGFNSITFVADAAVTIQWATR